MRWELHTYISHRSSSVAHLQTNGQVEVTNRTILRGLKTKLAEELDSVLWAYSVTLRSSTREPPFSLAYGPEGVIAAEIGIPSRRVSLCSAAYSDVARQEELDSLAEKRLGALHLIVGLVRTSSIW